MLSLSSTYIKNCNQVKASTLFFLSLYREETFPKGNLAIRQSFFSYNNQHTQKAFVINTNDKTVKGYMYRYSHYFKCSVEQMSICNFFQRPTKN